MKLKPVLTDEERFPLLKDQSFLKELRQDLNGPRFNFRSGDRLTADNLEKVKIYRQELDKRRFWTENSLPAWIDQYLKWCIDSVPAYKNYSEKLEENPTIRRQNIATAPWRFVSDECDAEELLVYSTSGTTGAPMDVLFDATTQATWIPQLESILARDGIRLEGGPDRVSICLVCSQKETLTYASLSTYLDGAGVLKINLNPDEWNKPEDRSSYLEKHNPEIITGDPLTFMTLAELCPDIRPKAMISSAMVLLEGTRKMLEEKFRCPVYDLYSLTECRMIAVAKKPGIYRLVRPELYVEILHPDKDETVKCGERGEITLTGGNNPFLALVRYRTGDFATLRHENDEVYLCELEGRQPTIFVTDENRFLNNVDVSRALSKFSFAAFTLHQKQDRSIDFCGWGKGINRSELKQTFCELFGPGIKSSISIRTRHFPETKKVQYTSDIKKADFIL
jgi:phenylacetate-CoA ligase